MAEPKNSRKSLNCQYENSVSNLTKRQIESGRYVIENGHIVKKRCGGCKEMKPISEYHASTQNRDGYSHHCVICRKKTYRKNRQNKGLPSRKSHKDDWFSYDKNQNPISRKCTVCGEEKPVNEFYAEKHGVHSIMSKCITCIKSYHADRYKRDFDKIRNQQAKALNKTYRNLEWRKANPDKTEHYLAKGREAARRRLSTSKGRLNSAISGAIRQCLKGNKNGWHWETLVDFDLNSLRKHLQKQFEPGMTWENYGKWEVDHISPLSKFNFSKPTHIDFKQAWCLKNLRPLWRFENRSKKDKVIKPFQISFAFEAQNEEQRV